MRWDDPPGGRPEGAGLDPAGDGVSRREFLGAATALGAAAWGGAAPAQTAAPRAALVGAHPWVYAATQPGYDLNPILERVFADMAYARVGGIELMHTVLADDAAVGRIRALSRKYRLPVLGASYGAPMWDPRNREMVLADVQKIVARLAALGGRSLGVSVGNAPTRKTPEQLDAQAAVLRELIPFCAARRVVLNLHNHTYEVENDLHDLKGTLERVPDVKLGPDLNWLVRAGVDPVEFLRTYGSRVVLIHLRDQHADGRWSEALGEGDMDYAAIAGALKAIRFRGYAVIELAHEPRFRTTRPLRESLKISRDFVRETLGY